MSDVGIALWWVIWYALGNLFLLNHSQDSGTVDDLVHLEVVFNLSQVIATRTFTVLFLRLDNKRYEKWIVLIAQWSLIGTIVIGGPATARTDRHGPYCK